MPKKKGKNEQRELEEYTQKSKCSVVSDELSIFSSLSINDDSGDDDEEVSDINSILQDDLLEQILVYLPIASI
ncbi:unnamed protein product [Rhodiola kirilowii]